MSYCVQAQTRDQRSGGNGGLKPFPQTSSVRREEREFFTLTGDGEDALGSKGKRKKKKVDF